MTKITDLPKTRAFAKNPTYENWKVLPPSVQNFLLMSANSVNLKKNKKFMQVVDDNREAYKHIEKLENILQSVQDSIEQLSTVQVEQALETKDKIDNIMKTIMNFNQNTAKEDVMEVINNLDAKIDAKFQEYVNMINNRQTSLNPEQTAVIEKQKLEIYDLTSKLDDSAKLYDKMQQELTLKLNNAVGELSQTKSLNKMLEAQNTANTNSDGFAMIKYNVIDNPYFKGPQEQYNAKVDEVMLMKNDVDEAMKIASEFFVKYQNLNSVGDVKRVKKELDVEIKKIENKTVSNICTKVNRTLESEAKKSVQERLKAGREKAAIVKQERAQMEKVAQEKAKQEEEKRQALLAEEAKRKKAAEEEARKAAEEEAKRKKAAEAEARKAAEEEAKRKKAAEAEARKAAEEEAKRKKAAEEEAKRKQAADAKKAAEEAKKKQAAEEEARKAVEARKAAEEEARKAAEEEARKAEEADRLEAEKLAEARKVAKAEAEDKARREAREEAERLALEEAERLALEEATRLAAEARKLEQEEKELSSKLADLEAAEQSIKSKPSSKKDLRERMRKKAAKNNQDTQDIVKSMKEQFSTTVNM